MPREEYTSPALSTRQITVPRPGAYPSEEAREVHEAVVQTEQINDILAEETEDSLTAW